jgi:aerobic carbon-monoxide dehydrogenase medium subunit
LRGHRLTNEVLRQAGEIAASEVDPMDDNRGSADYKRDLVKVLVRRAAEQAIERLS